MPRAHGRQFTFRLPDDRVERVDDRSERIRRSGSTVTRADVDRALETVHCDPQERLAGYPPVGTTMGNAAMEQGNRDLLPPEPDEVAEERILSLLEKAKLRAARLAALLNRRGGRDTWPADQSELLPSGQRAP